MAWKKSTTTKHTCNEGFGPSFGRKTAGCPRCDELSAGAAPVRWACQDASEEARLRSAAIARHYRSDECSRTCGPVCTRFDW